MEIGKLRSDVTYPERLMNLYSVEIIDAECLSRSYHKLKKEKFQIHVMMRNFLKKK